MGVVYVSSVGYSLIGMVYGRVVWEWCFDVVFGSGV